MKKLTTLIAISSFFLLGDAKAQFTVDWAHDYSHTMTNGFSNEGRKVVPDSINGFIYTLCDVTSDKDPGGVVTGSTYHYVVLSKFDYLGTLLESAAINVVQHFNTGYEYRSGFGLQLDGSGNIYIGYNSYDATNSYDVNLAKYDINLDQVWNYKFNAVSEDLGIAMEFAQGTAYAILKSTAGGNIRHRIIKANAAGTSAIALYTYSAQPDYLADLVVDATQKIYVTGYRLVGGIKSILMSCVTNTGTLLWSRVDNCGTVTGDDYSRDIHLGNDGYLYITGQSVGTVQHGIDVVTMKFNPVNGKKMWENFINFNLADGGYFVLNPDPNYVYLTWVAGNNVYIDQLNAVDGTSIRRITYSPIPVTPYGSLSGAVVTDMKMSKRQNIYVTGAINGVTAGQNFSASYLIRASFTSRGLPQVEYAIPVTGETNENYRGLGIGLDEDEAQVFWLEDQFEPFATHTHEAVWLVSFDLPSAIRSYNNNLISSSSLSVTTWPNPVSSELHINANDNIKKVELSDMNGKIFLMKDVDGSFTSQLDVSDLAGGMYFLKVYDMHGNSALTKIIK
jgi:hypothetical protein